MQQTIMSSFYSMRTRQIQIYTKSSAGPSHFKRLAVHITGSYCSKLR